MPRIYFHAHDWATGQHIVFATAPDTNEATVIAYAEDEDTASFMVDALNRWEEVLDA